MTAETRKLIEKSIIFFSAFIYCGGYMTGSDWATYEPLYESATWTSFFDYNREKGFYLTMLLFKALGFNFFFYLIVQKLCVFFIIVTFLKKYYRPFLLPFSIFLSTNALFLLVDNPLRYMIALGIVVYAFHFLLERKLFKFSLFIGIAATFHISSLFVLVAYFVRLEKLSKTKLLIAYLVLLIFWTPSNVIYILDNSAPSVVTLLGWYYKHFLLIQSETYFTIGWVFNQVLFLTVLYYKNEIISYTKYGKVFFSLSIFYFFVTAFFGLIPTFFRIPMYLAIFLYISAAVILTSSSYMVIRRGIVLYLILATIKNIYSTYIYIPYTNYYIYTLFSNEKPYDYRLNYNKVEYLNRKGEMPPEYFNPED